MSRNVDLSDEARSHTREEFVRNHPEFLLVGTVRMEAPIGARRTDIFGKLDDDMPEITGVRHIESLDTRGEPHLVILPVRKVQENFQSMITVGRTANNDLWLADVGISRFHAFFRVHEDRVELADAGSANGTWVGKTRLPPKGPAQIVVPGERVAFAQLEFEFLDAGAAWDRVRSDPSR
jgi:pSer/pThr/pTyr-binding forkhead associated (FHA) protein